MDREIETKAAAEPGEGPLLQSLAGALGRSASTKTVFGDPVQREGRTLIPVAKVRYGFGGGSGKKKESGEEGRGGGGGVAVSPLGFIEMTDRRVRFRRIRRRSPLLALVPALLVGLLAARAFYRARAQD